MNSKYLNNLTDAYLDIETTGLSSYCDSITVIGIYLVNGCAGKVVQLVGEKATRGNLLKSLEKVNKIYTYNGSRFDLPFIHACLEVNLEKHYHHHDLMYDCWRRNLKGGFKAVEEKLCITRHTRGITGWDAVRLWWKYKNDDDLDALKTLLEYNKEDVVNLKALREKLEGY